MVFSRLAYPDVLLLIANELPADPRERVVPDPRNEKTRQSDRPRWGGRSSTGGTG